MRWAVSRIWGLEHEHGSLIRGALARRKGPQPGGGMISMRDGLEMLPRRLAEAIEEAGGQVRTGVRCRASCAPQAAASGSRRGPTAPRDDRGRARGPRRARRRRGGAPRRAHRRGERADRRHPLRPGRGGLLRLPAGERPPPAGRLRLPGAAQGVAPGARLPLPVQPLPRPRAGGLRGPRRLRRRPHRPRGRRPGRRGARRDLPRRPGPRPRPDRRADLPRAPRWPRAIPQYEVGHGRYVELAARIEAERPGIYLSGNWTGGVSVPDCIQTATELAERIVTERTAAAG